jgi:hypothetical protein
MRVSSLEAIFRALNEAQAEYLVVGGVAVIAHGHMRMTNDLDLVLSLSSNQLPAALRALHSVGLRPRIPVDILDFANAELRARWQDEKGMIVFNLFHADEPDLVVDIFVTEPFDFKVEYTRAKYQEFAPGVFVPLVSLSRLIAMKKAVGRPQDLIDVEKLAILQSLTHEDSAS